MPKTFTQQLLKQVWHCDHCDRFGFIWHPAEEDCLSKMSTAIEQHAIMEEKCWLENSGKGVRFLGEATLAGWS